jgi:26S proteasome regulatory subunit N5
MISNSRVLVSIVQACFKAKDWRLLQEQIALLCKKHGLIKEVIIEYLIPSIITCIFYKAVTRMIQECIKYVEQAPDQKTKLEYIDTLRTVTDGKIYVEVERARLTRTLVAIKEKEGQINEAAEILQDVQIETFASMEQREKTDFILEQMRLNLQRKDYIRMQIVSRKINTKYFANEETQDLKLRFYELMIQHALHDHQYLNVCKFYREVYQTKSVQSEESKWAEILRYIVVFAVLAPFDNEQSDLLHRIKLDKNLEKMPLYKYAIILWFINNDYIYTHCRQLVKLFTTHELMRWPKIEEMYRSELQKSFVFDQSNADGVKRWKDIHTRVVEHVRRFQFC